MLMEVLLQYQMIFILDTLIRGQPGVKKVHKHHYFIPSLFFYDVSSRESVSSRSGKRVILKTYSSSHFIPCICPLCRFLSSPWISSLDYNCLCLDALLSFPRFLFVHPDVSFSLPFHSLSLTSDENGPEKTSSGIRDALNFHCALTSW